VKLSPDRSDAVSAAIREIARKVQDATLAPDTDAARRALNEVWFATHRAAELINEAERATRAEALQRLENAA
jgi:hypothetical protein